MTIQEITQKLANAYVTSSLALGHSKTRENDILVKGYCNQLKVLGFDPPDLSPLSEGNAFKDYLAAIGKFNGEGSH